MYKINLIRGWQKTSVYKSYRNQIIFWLSLVAFVLIGMYLFLFVRFLYLQRELTSLSNTQFLTRDGQTYTATELTKTLYSLEKLEQIGLIYNQYPEFYLYHNFLLKKIFRFDSLTVDKYNLDRQHKVEVVLSSPTLDEIFALIAVLENPDTAQYFSLFEVNSVGLSKDSNEQSEQYSLDFVLQFNDKLLNEKN